jgi:multiple sugar transport system substrate-binding protein
MSRCARVLAVLLVAGVCGSCAAETGPQDEAAPAGRSSNAAADVASSVRIRVLAEMSPTLNALERVAREQAPATGRSVELVRRDHAGVVAALWPAVGAAQDHFDLLIVPHRLVGRLVEDEAIQPLDTWLMDPSVFQPGVFDPAADLFAGWWRELSWYRGRAYGYPFLIRATSLWYREDLFGDEDEAVAFERRFRRPLMFPRTPSELQDVAGFFHRPAEQLYGTVVVGRGGSLWSEWLQYAAMFGARVLDSRTGDSYGDIVVNSPEAITATEFQAALRRTSVPGAEPLTDQEAVGAFSQRAIAAAVLRHDLVFTGEQPNAVRGPGGLGYAPAPHAPRSGMTVEGQTFLIPRRAAHAREAFEFMQWALSHDTQAALLVNGGLAVRPSGFADPTVTALPRQYQSRPFMQILQFPKLFDGITLEPTPTVPEAEEIANTVAEFLSRILAGEATARDGLYDAARRIERLIDGKAKRRFR